MESAAASGTGFGLREVSPLLPDPLSILLVGEGNLSFAYSLVRRLSRSAAFRRATQSAANTLGSATDVVATTYDAEDELAAKYPESAAFRAYFAAKQRVPVRYVGSINATALTSSLADAGVDVAGHAFQLVVFNNPHIGFEDLYRQRSLISHFFASAAELCRRGPVMCQPQEVVVALCDEQAQRWDLLGCAARSGYLCVAAQPLLSTDFPEYVNRRHQSDTAFPFRRMVQYWFVQPAPKLLPTLRELRREIKKWERDCREQSESKKPCSSFDCASWLQMAESLLPDDASLLSESPSCGAALGNNGDCTCLNSSLDYTAGDAEMPMPLLHPSLVARVLPSLLRHDGATIAPSPTADYFTPYLPSATWVPLYQAQRLMEERSRGCGAAMPAAANRSEAAAAPPHLDAAQLGRPLTMREAKKLERYLSGYGAAMRVKARQQKKESAAASASAAKAWVCTDCTPSRTFGTQLDLRQHRTSRHSGAVQLAPTLYARVHTQIEKSAVPSAGDSLDHALAAMSLEDRQDGYFCDVCGLQYKTSQAYDEHLHYLSPLPGGGDDAPLLCDLCDPPKRFTDRRGLEQHRYAKHSSTSLP